MDIKNYMGLEAILNFNDFKVKNSWWICQIQIPAYFKTIYTRYLKFNYLNPDLRT